MSRHPEGVFVPHNRLARILDAPDGKSFEDLVAAAEANVIQLKASGHNALKGRVTDLLALCDQPEDIVFGESERIVVAAGLVVEDARQLAEADIAETAGGIAAMIQALFDYGAWHTEALEVHVQALKVLVSGVPPSTDERATILREITRMRSAIGVL